MKLLSCKGSLPWITQEIKRLIRKRDRLYTACKASGDSGKSKNFLALRQLIKRKINTSPTLKGFSVLATMISQVTGRNYSPS